MNKKISNISACIVGIMTLLFIKHFLVDLAWIEVDVLGPIIWVLIIFLSIYMVINIKEFFYTQN